MSLTGPESLSLPLEGTLEVAPEQVSEVLARAREEGFDLLLDLAAYEPELGELTVRYQLASSQAADRNLVVRTKVGGDYPALPSVAHIYPMAEVLEREVFDLFGIVFGGHPHLSRLFLTEADQCFPLRKSFRLDRAGWGEVKGE